MSTPKKSKAKLSKRNKLGYVGIALWADGKYRAQFKGKKVSGRFNTAVAAAQAYDKVAYEALGDKANLNFPPK